MYSFTDYQGIDAKVFAVNQYSAEAQLSWVVKMYDCFCKDCCARYKADYYVEIMNPTIGTCKELSLTKGTRFV